MTRAAVALLAVALAGCPRFHAERVPDPPPGASFVEVDGVHVRYRDTGRGPAVVLLHGFGGSLDHWAAVQPELARAHRVIAVDLKGFGWTSRPAGDYSPAAQARLVWRVLDRLGVSDVAIVGHSWGSSVALSMAVAHPERTRRVAVYSAYVYDEQVPSFFRWGQLPGVGELLFALFYKERIDDRAPLAYLDEGHVTQARVERVERDLAQPGTTMAALAAVRGHHFAGLHEQLTRFDRPVLILWGAQDIVTPVRYGHRLAAELSNARLEVYERCGHVPMVEARARSTRDLAEFLAEDRDPDAATSPPAVAAEGALPGGDARGESDPTPGAVAPPGAPGSGDASSPAGRDGVTEAPRAGQAAVAAGGAPGAPTPAGAEPDVQPARRILEPVAPSFGPGGRRELHGLHYGADLAALGAELTPRNYAAPRERTEVVLHGLLRARETGLYNLDLDRGLDAEGQPVFPVPLSGGQLVRVGDLRARTDLAIYARGVGVAVKARVDWLDNVAIGGAPDLRGGSPATSGGQAPASPRVKRAYGEALTPAGTLAAGRMGAHFGLGIAANGGDCEECDAGDSADRVAFVSPLAGHLLAVAYDVAARGPFTPGKGGNHQLAIEPSASAHGPTLALLKVHSPATLERRARARLLSLEYAAYLTRRTQQNDVPASYLPTASPTTTFTGDDLVGRGFAATGAGGWLRLASARVRVEAELAFLAARVDQPSLIPGAEITLPVTSRQLGLAVQSAALLGPAQVGLDAGYASGDDAPGFGAFPTPGQLAPRPGAFEGAQASPPRDRTVDNFRFHPDFRIDHILFREIIGTVTDAIYVRPHVRARLLEVGAGRVEAVAALIASWASEPSSTPSGARPLGVELDPELRYASSDGFIANVAYGLLLPGAAFDGSTLAARPAQALRVRVGFVF